MDFSPLMPIRRAFFLLLMGEASFYFFFIFNCFVLFNQRSNRHLYFCEHRIIICFERDGFLSSYYAKTVLTAIAYKKLCKA